MDRRKDLRPVDNVLIEPVARPKYGSIDHFAAQLRDSLARHKSTGLAGEANMMAAVLGIIQSTARGNDQRTDTERIEHIRNVLAAELLVRAELAEAAR